MVELNAPILIVGRGLFSPGAGESSIRVESGVDLVECESATLALQALNSGRDYAAVFYELRMSDMDAGDFLHCVHTEFPAIPAIAVISPCEVRQGILAMLSGASDFVQTPLCRRNVLASLGRATKRKCVQFAMSNGGVNFSRSA